MSDKPQQLTTMGKGLQEILRYIWKNPQIDLTAGPEAIFEQLFRNLLPPGITPESLINEYGKLPAMIAKFVELQERNQEILNALWEAYQQGRQPNGNDHDHDGDRRSIAGPGGTVTN